jgi:hypothetical protein
MALLTISKKTSSRRDTRSLKRESEAFSVVDSGRAEMLILVE